MSRYGPPLMVAETVIFAGSAAGAGVAAGSLAAGSAGSGSFCACSAAAAGCAVTPAGSATLAGSATSAVVGSGLVTATGSGSATATGAGSAGSGSADGVSTVADVDSVVVPGAAISSACAVPARVAVSVSADTKATVLRARRRAELLIKALMWKKCGHKITDAPAKTHCDTGNCRLDHEVRPRGNAAAFTGEYPGPRRAPVQARGALVFAPWVVTLLRVWKRVSFVGTFALWLVVVGVRWLVPRPVGIADNGDGWRMLCKLGLNDRARVSEMGVQLFYAPAPPCGSTYVSSQFWIDRVAVSIGQWLGGPPGLNLKLVGAIGCVLVALGLTVVVHALPVRPWYRVAAGAIVALVMLDSAFFGYFTSIISEGAAFAGLLLACGGLLLLRRDGLTRWFGGGVVVAGGVLAVNAKSQTLMVLPLLLVALLVLALLDKRRARWVVPGVVAVGLVAGTYALQSTGDFANEEYREINAYHAIFNSIVDGKHDTQRDLADLGLPPHFAQYIGTTWWSQKPAHTDPDYPRYQSRISNENIIDYYLSHPVRTAQILDQAASDMLTGRPENMGNFALGAGQPDKAKEYRVPVLSGITGLLAPAGLFAAVPLWLLVGWMGVRALRRDRRDLGVVVLFLLLVGIGQVPLAGLAEGIEGVKHQVIALFATLLAAAFAAISLLPTRRGEPEEPEREPATEQFAIPA
ncbi:hypothetical protein [Actinokineospora terrae]|uniref:glycan biosynthesis hexose transferase WsfD n=1 Tax=Actinokineospora terrae TaxID=155974 RepID=UPI003183C08F